MELLKAFQSLPEGKKSQLASQYGLKLHAITDEEFEAQLQRNIPQGLKTEILNLVKGPEDHDTAPKTAKLTKKQAVAFLKANELEYNAKATVDELNALVEGAIKERTEAKETFIGVDGKEVTFEGEKPEPTEPVVGAGETDEAPKKPESPKSKSQSRRKAASAGKKK